MRKYDVRRGNAIVQWVVVAALITLVIMAGVTLIGVSRSIEYELRQDVFRRLCRLSPAYYQTHRIGDLMSRATNDISAVRVMRSGCISPSHFGACPSFSDLRLLNARHLTAKSGFS